MATKSQITLLGLAIEAVEQGNRLIPSVSSYHIDEALKIEDEKERKKEIDKLLKIHAEDKFKANQLLNTAKGYLENIQEDFKTNKP